MTEVLASDRPSPRAGDPPVIKRLRSPARRHGSRRRARHRRRAVPIAIGLVLLLLLGAGGAAAWYEYSQARLVESRITNEMTAAQNDLETAKSLLSEAAADRDPQVLDRARAANENARAHFKQALRIAGSDPMIRQALSLPYAGPYVKPRLQAVNGLATMGLAISDTVADGADIDARLIKTDDVPGSGGAKLIQVLRESQPQIDRLQNDLQRAKVAVDSVDPAVLTGSQKASLDKARGTIDKGLAGVKGLKALIPALFEIMGANGPRTYLIEQMNPAELRGGGGFIGSYSVIEANNGNIKKVRSGAVDDIEYPRATKGQKNYVAPPKTMVEFIGDLSWVLSDSNFYPDFPANAKWAEYFAERELKIKPDGVLALDPVAVSYLLDVTGPIPIPAYNITVQSKDFVEFLFAYENGPGRTTSRKALLGVVADAILEHVSTLPATGWPKLMAALNKAGQERHFQAYFNSQVGQDQMAQYRWANDLNPAKKADWMMDVESNFGATKANHFITRSYDVTLARNGATLHHRVVVNLLEDLNAPVVPNQDNYYRAYARLYVPGNATNLAVKDLKADQYPNTELPPDTKLMDGWLQINPDSKTKKGTWTMTFDYDTPWSGDASGVAVLYWQKQPGTEPDAITVTYQANGQTYKATAKLASDQEVTLNDRGVAINQAQGVAAGLPSISL